MPIKVLTPAQKGAITRKKNQQQKIKDTIAEAKRQATMPLTITHDSEDDGGSHSIDHGTILDNHVSEDTNKESIEVIQERNQSDVSFWGGSWAWVHTTKSYGNKPEDSYFINPTPKLIGEVMHNVPTIYEACRVALTVGNYQDQLEIEQMRHKDFLQDADSADLVSESLDLMTSYQGRFFESVQRYLGLCASYNNARDAQKPDENRLEQAKMKKKVAGDQCRAWSARLIALVEAYHSTVSDERAYKLSYNLSPLPPQDGQPASRDYGLFKWAITQTLNKIGKRLTRSIKTGSMDAEKFRVPRPWLDEEHSNNQKTADDYISDFN